MKQKIFSLIAVLFFTAVVSVVAAPPSDETPVIKTTTKSYGMSLLANKSGIFTFDLNAPNTPTMLYQLNNNEIASAGAYANGRYYTMILSSDQKPLGLYTYNLKTGERELLRDMSDAASFFLDLTYDYTTSTMFALWQNYPNTTLIKVDLKNGDPTLVKDISNKALYSIAASSDGVIYVMSTSGIMYTVNKANGELTEIFSVGVNTTNFQSMDFDYNTGRLYWACQKYQFGSGINSFYEIDLNEKKAKEISGFPYLVGGLHTAFTEAVPQSPQTINNLKISVNQDLQPVLNWTNPNTTLENKPLANLSFAEIYRNDTLINKITGVTAGSAGEWTDTSAPNRVNTYKVITYTTSRDESIPAWASVFAGKDVPGAPLNVVATKINQTSASITWEAPVTGLHNSWFDKQSLAYKVVRMPDNILLANNISETSYVDERATAFANYTYQVVAVTSDGDGGSAMTDVIPLGESVQIPFSAPFDTQESLDLWTTFNRDELEESWYLGKLVGNKNGAESCTENSRLANNWLISPPLHLEKGKVYEVSFTAYTSYYNNEGLRITLGKELNPEAQTISVSDLKIKEYYGKTFSVTLPEPEESGTYYLGLQHYTVPADGWVLHINDLLIKEQDKGEVTGLVTDGTNPLVGVTVTLSADEVFVAKTDAQGMYCFNDVVPGRYKLKTTILGYEGKEEEISVSPLDKAEKNFVLAALPQYSISGKITDMAGGFIKGADVTISGYNKYVTRTGLEGEYSFDHVYQSDNYHISVRKNNFEPVSNPLSVLANVNNEAIKLVYKNIAPYSIKVVNSASSDGNITLNWERPIDISTYQYDNGQSANPLGYDAGSEYHILGSIYRVPTVIHRVKWFTLSGTNKKPYVHVYIIGLDERGVPTGQLLFSQKNIPTQDYVWTTFELPVPVNAPNGFMIALSGEGNIMIAKDDNPEMVEKQTQCYSTNYEYPSSYTYFDEVNWTGALMLRAEGEIIEPQESPVKVTYDLWRMLEKDQAKPEMWTKIKENMTGFEVTDEKMAALPMDTYKYAVAANYPVGNFTSEATISESVYHKQFTDVTINVLTNSVPEDADGAMIRLVDNKGNDYQITVSGKKAVFNKIWKGTYTLTIVRQGFERFEKILNASAEGQYEYSYTIIQKMAPVSNIDIMTTDKPAERQLLWSLFDNIEDGFDDDSYQDFEMNPAGNTGWQYVDNDRCLTYGFAATTFPHMREPMAAIIFNSNTTEPPLGFNTAFSGDRALGFFAARETEDEDENIIFHDSDDYLISPELNYHKDFTFSFYAKSYNDENGLERIRVGYSKTDALLNSFTYPESEYTSVPVEYTLYSYSIPKDAKYVTLNSHSKSSFLLLVDDLFIGTTQKTSASGKEGGGSFKNYKVYMDNKFVADTKNNQYLLTGLSAGKHTASVTKVYNSGESQPMTIDFTVSGGENIDATGNDEIVVYLTSENKLIIEGDYRTMRLYNPTGVLVHSEIQLREIDLNGFEKGVYVVYITTLGNHRSVHKIILK